MQNKNVKSNTKNSLNKNAKKIGYYLPIIFIITILPLITFGKVVELPIEEANFWKGGTVHVDFFNYYKSVTLIMATFTLICAYGGLFLNNKLPLKREKRYYIPMFIYALLVIISTIMSQNKHVAVEGFIDMYQGMFILLCYIVLTFIIMNYIMEEKDVKVMIYSFLIIAIVEGVLGLGQYFGYDFLQSSLGRWLITPKELYSLDLKFAFSKYTIYGTLCNTNFVGSFGTLVLPITTILFLLSNDRKNTVILTMATMLAFSTWLGSNSRAGYVGIVGASLIGIVLFRKLIREKFIKALLLIMVFIIITILFDTASGGRVLNQFSRLNPTKEAEEVGNIQEQHQVRFEEVFVNENAVTIKTNKETLIGIKEDSNLRFEDGEGSKLSIIVDSDGNIKFIDEKYLNYSFLITSEEPSHIEANIYNRNFHLYITPEKKIKIISMNNKLTEPVEAPHIKLFDGRETFASNRGYIWSRTIPMMKDTFFIGYGPDNFPMVFPQEDYVGRFNVGSTGMTDIVVDKPHNMYLQTAINTGVVSLLALLVMWSIYLIDSFKLYKGGNMSTFVECMGAAVFLSITAYLIAGIFNDSVVSVAPLFWILLGLGIGINNIIKGAFGQCH